jgi:peptide/nickel transport system ATP-binding protein/oligopeptide transport system ATP-binding protein
MSLLEIKNLRLEIAIGAGMAPVVDDLSLAVDNGETVGLVGESGCGKTTTALSIARLLRTPPFQYAGGQILLNARNVLTMSEKELREVRGSIVGYVFQEPGAALNPAYRIGTLIKDALKLHRPEAANDKEVIRLLGLVGISSPEYRIKDHPRQFSGGMQQRALLAIALAPLPTLLVADEPTAALDVTIQAQILDLLRDLKQRLGMALLFITHNLGILNNLADRVAVMYAGQIVEIAPTRDLLLQPLHPYTKALINSVPKLTDGAGRLSTIPGNVPRLGAFPPGCRFHPRCPSARPECANTMPALTEAEPGRWVRCPYAKSL